MAKKDAKTKKLEKSKSSDSKSKSSKDAKNKKLEKSKSSDSKSKSSDSKASSGFAKGTRVAKAKDAKVVGVVVKRKGAESKTCVDFSESGGKKEQWMADKELVQAPDKKDAMDDLLAAATAESAAEEGAEAETGSWKYKALGEGTIRKGSAMDSDKVDSSLAEGEIIECTARLEIEGGTVRVKFDRGWTRYVHWHGSGNLLICHPPCGCVLD